MKRTTLRVIVNIGIAAVVIVCWVAMVFGSGGSLADTGLRSLKYFTVLSNFLAAIAAIVWLCAGRTRGGRTQSIEQPNTNLRVPSREEDFMV